MPTKQTEWSRAYNARAYDRLNIVIPKGRKQAIEAHVKARGESVNNLVNRMLRIELGLSEQEWKETAKEDADS